MKNSTASSLARAARRIGARFAQPAPIASPFSEGNLAQVVLADMAGLSAPRQLTRAQAMSVPSVAKARALILASLARQPLALYQDNTELEPPAWLYRSDTLQSPITRIAWTLDDLLFYGRSVWAIERDNSGTIIDGIRLPQDYWDIKPDGSVWVALEEAAPLQPVSSSSLIVFEGLQEGLLDIAGRTLTAAIDLEQAWSNRITSALPLVELHETERDTEINETEAADIAAKWEAARRRSGTAFTPYGIEMRAHGDKTTDLFVEGRNALRLDVALFTNIPSTLLEGSQATASLTYSTQEGRRNELLDYSLSFWAAPIEARLSMDDVTPPGTRIAFNVEYFSQPTQPAGFPALRD